MADTHINAFFADVENARIKAVQAQGELDAAKQRLEAKKAEVDYDESKEAAVEEEVGPTSLVHTVSVGKSLDESLPEPEELPVMEVKSIDD